MVNPHKYSSGTEKALFHMSRGTCYFPDCETSIIADVQGHPIVGVEIAHIRGAEPTSARYDSAMTDDERREFGNLILLCKPHHTFVDITAREAHPKELLEEWKKANEPPEGLGIFTPRLTEATLFSALEEFAVTNRPFRDVDVELRGGIVTLPEGVSTVPLGDLALVIGANQHLSSSQLVLVIDIRNTGTLPVTVEAVDFEGSLKTTIVEEEAKGSLLGRNDLPKINPRLPTRLEDSASVQWFQTIESMHFFEPDESIKLTKVRGVVRLGTGERLETDWVSWPDEFRKGGHRGGGDRVSPFSK